MAGLKFDSLLNLVHVQTCSFAVEETPDFKLDVVYLTNQLFLALLILGMI